MSLSSKGLLVALNIHTWTARRIDQKATQTVADRHKVERGMGRYNKLLIPVTDSFTAIQKANTEAREWHYAHTLGWVNKGAQFLPTPEYLEYANQMRIFHERFDKAVDAFVAEYPDLKAHAKRKLNGLYREDDYPSVKELRRKYGFDYTFLPVPDTEHFFVQVSKAEQEKMKAKLEAKLQEAQAEAMRDLWTRLHEPVAHMAAALADPERRFHDTLVTNVKEMVEVLPRLNFTNDPQLEDTIAETRKLLTKFSPQTLRDDEDKRAITARRAAEIAERMKGFVRR